MSAEIVDIRRRFADPAIGTTHSDMGTVLAAVDRLVAVAQKIKAMADGDAAKINLHTDIPCVGCELDDALDGFSEKQS